ncbi:MAG: 3-oxoadipate enol-lactonase [Chloroflexi bacterium]|nr:3-oxoadipate enol-lactonase [Chloroflexota bacterium]
MSPRTLGWTVDGSPGESVLVLSGSLGTTATMWDPQVPLLSRERCLVRVDHPGHGRSPVWDGPVGVADIGGAILDVLDRLGMQRFSFCGLSLGGAAGQWVAAHAPERVERLVLCSTAARFTPPEVYVQRAATVRREGMDAIAASAMERWFTLDFREREPGIVERFRATLAATPPEGYAQCCEAVAGFDGGAGLTRIAAPTLVLVGADDPATPPERARHLHRGIAGSRLEIIEGAAHLVNVERPDAIETAIRDHLRRGRQP